MKKLYIIGLSGLLFIQCTQVDPLERALQSSGYNRPQLESSGIIPGILPIA